MPEACCSDGECIGALLHRYGAVQDVDSVRNFFCGAGVLCVGAGRRLAAQT